MNHDVDQHAVVFVDNFGRMSLASLKSGCPLDPAIKVSLVAEKPGSVSVHLA